jgi:predicted DNA-binding helix-hairpin-helix protein
MEVFETLNTLSEQMDLEPAEDMACPRLWTEQTKPSSNQAAGVIFQPAVPKGPQISLMKSLLTSACERNCFYCPFRSGRDFRRATLKPDEMAHAFMAYQKSGIAEGLFLSSGIAGGGLATQDKLIATAELLRNKHNFKGYLHLKIMPGVERAQVERAMQLADRVSINLEAPNTQRLQALAPRKEFIQELLQPLQWVEEIRQSLAGNNGWQGRWPSSATQFVVGGAGESDTELLRLTEYLHNTLRLKRVYFSAFRPIQGTPLENQPAESPQRQLRLYQAAFLIRDYGYKLNELPIDSTGRLPKDVDPKYAWAELHLRESPLEINRANYQELIRIPGIGPVTARSIIKLRRTNRFLQIEDLHKAGVNPDRASPFILLNGKYPTVQLSFW